MPVETSIEKNENTTDNLVEVEHRILDFWRENQTFNKLVSKNANGPIFRFLDGPITANNPMGVHHAWGRTIKDSFLRYKAMHGFLCNWQNGFDSQGLWVEVEVERDLGFQGKPDIENFGVERFIEECKKRVVKFSNVITQQSIRLGQWMNWDNSYFTHTDQNIEGIWHFLKTCHEKGWIYSGPRLLAWCPRCGTSLSEHEMTGSYRLLTHTAVYVQIPLIGRDAYILAWTTTPWTLAANVALAVNPNIEYVEARLEGQQNSIILAKDSLKILKNRKKKILGTIQGRELLGLKYEPILPDLDVQKGIDHTIIGWESVDPQEGTGVVHIAPACGPEDYELSIMYKLPVLSPVDDRGRYFEDFGYLAGNAASDVADQVVEHLQKHNRLFEAYPHEHRYPVCWRCKTPSFYRLASEWYINCNEVRPLLIEAARNVRWDPDYMLKRMEDWLTNMGDWNISRKRYYGLPLPIYPCPSCGKVTIVGSKAELRELGGPEVDKLPELHRPWIDTIKIKCPHCGTLTERIPEVGDVWLDAGIVPYSTLGYFQDRSHWQKYYPVEWITEMREQVRLWFYSMLFMGVTLHERAPYERVLAHESVVAEDGTRFSKTGYMIQFDQAAEEIGADITRYLFAAAPVTGNVRFGYQLADEARRRFLVFLNVQQFFNTYARLEDPKVLNLRQEPTTLHPTDRWLMQRTNAFRDSVTVAMDGYSLQDVIREFDAYIEDLSTWYVRVNRRRFWQDENIEDKRAAYWTLFQAIRMTVQLMAPIIPFMTESVWQNTIRVFDPDAAESVHLTAWPERLPGEPSVELLKRTDYVRHVISLALQLRNQSQIKVRQPLSTLYVVAAKEYQAALGELEATVKDQLNVKEMQILPDQNNLETPIITLNFRVAGPALKQQMPEIAQRLKSLTESEMGKIVSSYRAGQSIQVPGIATTLSPDLFQEGSQTKSGVSIAAEDGVVVALDTVLTPALIAEGLARDVVRHVQVLRKDAGLRVEQHIALGVTTQSAELVEAVNQFKVHAMDETLAHRLVVNEPLEGTIASKAVTEGDVSFTISIADVK